ncbi:MAG: enoyl-CoA hydratase/isomerase family protein [Alphaproteobacteria bacterium]|nr:enoyl-CoA hydratase/isomerase family protein [Alphaproteobacteria bacterium]
MTIETIGLAVADHIATVTLQRPPVNALNRAARQAFIDIFDMLNDRTDVRCIVLTGSGRTFCAGADIKERAGLADEPGIQLKLNRLVRDLFLSIKECSKPVIAAVNGPAIGAGMCLALSCDILLAADTATFAMPEIDVGIAGGIKFLAPHFSPSKTRRLLLTGQRVPAPELYRLGVVEECVPADKLMPTALALAGEIAAKSPLVVGLLKESFNMVENLSFRDGYQLEQMTSVAMTRSEDSKEAKRAFIEKRKPVYKGR